VGDAIYELESSAQAGNLNSTPEYTLSMIEKTVNTATEFTTTFNFYLDGEKGGDHVDVIHGANELAQSPSNVLTNVKGITRLTQNDEASDKLVAVAKTAGNVGLRFFLNLQSYKLDLLQRNARKDVPLRVLMVSRGGAQQALRVGRCETGQGSRPWAGEWGHRRHRRVLSAARTIEAATQKLQEFMVKPKDTRYSAVEAQVHDSILQAALGITNAIGRLIRAATASQQEIVAHGKGSTTRQQFYKRNNRWTKALISAAKAVALVTTWLIQAADGVLSGPHTRAAHRRVARQGVAHVPDTGASRSRRQGGHRGVQGARPLGQSHLRGQAGDHTPDYADPVHTSSRSGRWSSRSRFCLLNEARRLGQMRATGYHEEDD